MDGDTTTGNPVYEKFLNKCNSFKLVHEWVYSIEFYNFFLNLFKEVLINEYKTGSLKVNFQKEYNFFSKPYELSEVFGIKNFEKKNDEFFFYPRLDVGYGKKNYGLFNGGSGPHIDNPQRLISILIFLGGYDYLEGGEHRIYEKKNNNLEIFESLEPVKNRIVASVQNNFAFHDVNPIKKIEGQRNALYLAISSNKKIWNDCEKNSFNKKYNPNRYNYSKYENLINTYKKKIKFHIHKLTK
tara:strand:+ start:159 stop:881 length:723 start_codon:yes stop_codon:yes gene_type:complete